jgi:hypothetical protein
MAAGPPQGGFFPEEHRDNVANASSVCRNDRCEKGIASRKNAPPNGEEGIPHPLDVDRTSQVYDYREIEIKLQ